MKKILLFLFLINSLNTVKAQINLKDSTVQVIGYWSKQDIQSYDISQEKTKIKNNDTISREIIKYEVDIKVIDSTENSYTIEWFYKNYSINSDNELMKKIISIANNISVKIKTDEYGAFIEILNWEDIRDYLSKVTLVLKEELKDIPNAEKIVAQVMSLYSSKESIEANTIKDALQYYTFHGGMYTLGEELEGKLETMNNFGGNPFDTDLTVILDEINGEDGNSVMRMYQNINSEQLTDATYDYLKNLGTFGDEIPPRNEFPSLTNETWTASRIHGETGWIIFSIETKETNADDTTNIEKRIIEIK